MTTTAAELPSELVEIRQRYGRPLTSDEIGEELGQLARARIGARDWHELPKGYYAIPVEDWAAWDELADEDAPVPVLGYRLFQRKVARRCNNGRVIGRDAFVSGATMIAPGADEARLIQEISAGRALDIEFYGPAGPTKAAVDDIVLDIARGDTYRATYGRLTGKCGCCGKALTDPKSKLLGIGPDCRGYR